MAHLLDYSPRPARDHLAAVLGATTWAAFFVGPIVGLIALTHQHMAGFGDLRSIDIPVTAAVFMVPIMGIVSAFWLIWRRGQRAGRETACIVSLLLFHAGSLFLWGGMEARFWGL